MLGAKVLFLLFVVPNILLCLEVCPGKVKGCHILGLINSLGSLVLITLKEKLTLTNLSISLKIENNLKMLLNIEPVLISLAQNQ